MKQFTNIYKLMMITLVSSLVLFVQAYGQEQVRVRPGTSADKANAQVMKQADIQNSAKLQVEKEYLKAKEEMKSTQITANNAAYQPVTEVNVSTSAQMAEKPMPNGVYKNPATPKQGGDDIASAVAITLPYFNTGTTVGYTNDYDEVCPYSGSTAPDVVYSLTGVNSLVTIDLCNSLYDTKVYVYDASMTLMACNDDYGCGYSGYQSYAEFTATGGTYYIIVDGYGTSAGDYEITVEEGTPCDVVCPGGSTPEGEVDVYDDYEDMTNGGCNSVPPVFGSISDGETICGTMGTYLYTGLNYRDTDWYVLDLTGDTYTITLTGESETPLLLYLLQETGAVGDCAYGAQIGLTFAPCEIGTVTAGGATGIWYVFAAPSVFDGYPGGNDYWISIDLGGSSTIPNDDCATAEYVGSPFPQTIVANNVGAGIDCPGVLDWPAIWYEVEMPYACNNLDITMCGLTYDYNTIGIVIYDDCSDCNAYIIADYYTWGDYCGLGLTYSA